MVFIMKLTFIGTGAADWDWANMPPGTRGSTATLIDGACLVDAGPTVFDSLERFGADPAQISDIVVTHSHGDHFRPQTVAAISAVRQGRLAVWASPQALAKLDGVDCVRHEVGPGQRFACGAAAFTALPSNHQTEDVAEVTMHYLVEASGVALLYALDGAWMLAKARSILKGALGGRRLDAVVWDATSGNSLRGWRFADHNDLAMIDALRASMLGDGLVSESTVHVFDHVARGLWPETAEGRAEVAESYGGILAEDGGTLDIPDGSAREDCLECGAGGSARGEKAQ